MTTNEEDTVICTVAEVGVITGVLPSEDIA